MSPIEQQRSPIRALVVAALQSGVENPEAANQIDAAFSGSLDDPWTGDFFCVSLERSKNESDNSGEPNH